MIFCAPCHAASALCAVAFVAMLAGGDATGSSVGLTDRAGVSQYSELAYNKGIDLAVVVALNNLAFSVNPDSGGGSCGTDGYCDLCGDYENDGISNCQSWIDWPVGQSPDTTFWLRGPVNAWCHGVEYDGCDDSGCCKHVSIDGVLCVGDDDTDNCRPFITFRGSYSPTDWHVDFSAVEALAPLYNNGNFPCVVRSFRDSYYEEGTKSIHDHAWAWINDDTAYQRWKDTAPALVTGYSLGGAYAQLAAFDLQYSSGDEAKPWMQLIIVNAPLTGTLEFAQWLDVNIGSDDGSGDKTTGVNFFTWPEPVHISFSPDFCSQPEGQWLPAHKDPLTGDWVQAGMYFDCSACSYVPAVGDEKRPIVMANPGKVVAFNTKKDIWGNYNLVDGGVCTSAKPMYLDEDIENPFCGGVSINVDTMMCDEAAGGCSSSVCQRNWNNYQNEGTWCNNGMDVTESNPGSCDTATTLIGGDNPPPPFRTFKDQHQSFVNVVGFVGVATVGKMHNMPDVTTLAKAIIATGRDPYGGFCGKWLPTGDDLVESNVSASSGADANAGVVVQNANPTSPALRGGARGPA